MSLRPDKPVLRLDWCSHEAAKYAVMNWHYSKSMPAGKLVKIGVWEDEKFIGVVLFGRGASKNLAKPYNLKQTECVELVRIALTKHNAPVTKIARVALRMLKRLNSGIRLVVSFADPNNAHVGIIYQGGNWIYTGQNPAKVHFRDNHGKIWHSRQVTATGINTEFGQRRRCLKRSDCETVNLMGKHRYLMPLDKEMRKQVEKLAKPYPKKSASKA